MEHSKIPAAHLLHTRRRDTISAIVDQLATLYRNPPSKSLSLSPERSNWELSPWLVLPWRLNSARDRFPNSFCGIQLGGSIEPDPTTDPVLPPSLAWYAASCV